MQKYVRLCLPLKKIVKGLIFFSFDLANIFNKINKKFFQ
jgi:hypothetical protein